jgi:hypothetical protein
MHPRYQCCQSNANRCLYDAALLPVFAAYLADDRAILYFNTNAICASLYIDLFINGWPLITGISQIRTIQERAAGHVAASRKLRIERFAKSLPLAQLILIGAALASVCGR